MKFELKDPSFGDMIRVGLGTIFHFGIYVSDDEVIQFGLPPNRRSLQNDSEVEVLATDIDGFLAGGFLEVAVFDKKEKKKHRSPKDAVAYARSKLGTRGYHILYNNCEHFAYECITGEKVCRQAEDLRELLRSIPIVDVYLARLPSSEIGEPLACKERNEEIERCTNERVKREKYFIWKLLCYALDRSLGIRGDRLCFQKKSYGGWEIEKGEFSLSHCGDMLAVAISRNPIGIDIERVHAPKAETAAKRIMNDAELKDFENTADEKKDEKFIEIWSAKEAIFKSQKKDAFIPKDIDTKNATFKSGRTELDGESYVYSVATPTPEKLRLFSDIDLSKL